MQIMMSLACNLHSTRLREEMTAQLQCKINNYYMTLSVIVLFMLLSEKKTDKSD